MGNSTMTFCVKEFVKTLFECNDTAVSCYLRNITQKDVILITTLHLHKHGVSGMIVSLDCMHVYWDMCPSAYRGQYKSGFKHQTTIVLEAVADYNSRIWHCNFGYPGTFNDINVWHHSTLHNSFVSGQWNLQNLDFEYTIGNECFNNIYILVDGVNPNLV